MLSNYEFNNALIENNKFRLLRSKEEVISAYFLYGYRFFSMARTHPSIIASYAYLKLFGKKNEYTAYDIYKEIQNNKQYFELKPLFSNLYKLCQQPYLRFALAYVNEGYWQRNFNLYVICSQINKSPSWFSNWSFRKNQYNQESCFLISSVNFPSAYYNFSSDNVCDLKNIDLG